MVSFVICTYVVGTYRVLSHENSRPDGDGHVCCIKLTWRTLWWEDGGCPVSASPKCWQDLSQISSGSAIPLAVILLLALPDDPSTIFVHGLILSITGFFISWKAPATNNPIFAEIVREKARTSIYALDRCFESVLSSFAPPVVGVMAENVYGYKPVSEGTEHIMTDRGNATSLAKALYTAIGIPMALCCLIYSFLYRTYPCDRQRAQMQALIDSELQLMEMDAALVTGNYLRFKPEAEELHLDDRTILEMNYGEEGFDLDDEDEKTSMFYRSKLGNSSKS